MAAGRRAAATLTRPSLRLLYSNFCEPEFNIGECRAQGIESRPVNLLACAARRGAEVASLVKIASYRWFADHNRPQSGAIRQG